LRSSQAAGASSASSTKSNLSWPKNISSATKMAGARAAACSVDVFGAALPSSRS
jgi:hypothetical protein